MQQLIGIKGRIASERGEREDGRDRRERERKTRGSKKEKFEYLCNHFTCLCSSSERYQGDLGMRHERVASFTSQSEHQIDNPRRDPCFVQNLAEHVCSHGCNF